MSLERPPHDQPEATPATSVPHRSRLLSRRDLLAAGTGAGLYWGLQQTYRIVRGVLSDREDPGASPEANRPVLFEDIPEETNLLRKAMIFRIPLVDGTYRTVTMRILPHETELVLELNGVLYQSLQETQDGKNITHSDFIKGIVKRHQGLYIDCMPYGIAYSHPEHFGMTLDSIVNPEEIHNEEISTSIRAVFAIAGMGFNPAHRPMEFPMRMRRILQRPREVEQRPSIARSDL